VASSRWISHPSIRVDCPVCYQPLPPIVVDVDARAGSVASVAAAGRGNRVLRLKVRAQTLDAAWWAAARVWHPDCIPADVGVQSR
jgi:hypothetical protein